ncbi:MAG: tRNA pseudouridine(38-40) synthase TruA [SAR324 cluster bacterium]|nr:tRNA pseudouridine(38-40) synthase TruA [SAR324 cluster bacterium]
MLLAYDGFHYHGWQIQTSHNTIEAELEKAIQTLTGKKVKICGAGRTDAQVHALNQTASFFSDADFSPLKWRTALNAVLPSDITVKSVLAVPECFHARHNSIAKRYRYLIFNHPFPSPFSPHYSWWIQKPLDLAAMKEAARYFIGEHDFSAFRSSQCSSPSPVKNIKEISIRSEDTPIQSLSIEIEANSFLQHMVRIIVGTLVDVGQHRFSPESILQMLKSRDRQKSGKTAPPYGLYVLSVIYKSHEIQWPSSTLSQ